MIRQGLLCRSCTGNECRDKGTESEPIDIECPSCSGEGCDECNRGLVRIDGCPQSYCRDMAYTVRLADLFDKGLPPVAGGSLDQSAWFLDAVGIFRYDESQVKAEANGE